MIHLQDVDFAYHKNRPVLRNLTVQLRTGHIYGLLGKNGSGKSTLLKIIAGLAFPKKGRALLDGIEIARRQVATLQQLYFLPEEVFVPPISPEQFYKRTAGFYTHFQKNEFYHYLEALDVDALTPMDQMSFGQQKKAMIAFGLATNCRLLIMDEPTNGLDIPSKAQFRKLIAAALNNNRCMILSTHQVRDLDSLIDAILVLHEQRIVVDCSIDDLAEKLVFGLESDVASTRVFYEEETFRGNYVIAENSRGKYSKPDLELFFNAITSGHYSVLEQLHNTATYE
jgi:ABC-2 type transport system ATP-binding protein